MSHFFVSNLINLLIQMAPKFILYPADDEDVIKAINYAKATGVAIATRSGGHQYSGNKIIKYSLLI